MNRYSNKRKHIDAQKKKFLKTPFMGCAIGMSFEQYLATRSEWDREYRRASFKQGGKPACEQYWNITYISGPKSHAKKMTSRIIRSRFQNKVNSLLLLDEEDIDDVNFGNNGNYRKYFDYAWTVF